TTRAGTREGTPIERAADSKADWKWGAKPSDSSVDKAATPTCAGHGATKRGRGRASCVREGPVGRRPRAASARLAQGRARGRSRGVRPRGGRPAGDASPCFLRGHPITRLARSGDRLDAHGGGDRHDGGRTVRSHEGPPFGVEGESSFASDGGTGTVDAQG